MENMTMQQKTYSKLLTQTKIWKAEKMRKNKTRKIVLLINKIIKYFCIFEWL